MILARCFQHLDHFGCAIDGGFPNIAFLIGQRMVRLIAFDRRAFAAVDAIDLATSERPEVVVIASSDSDFAPLVSRLREKGCRVIGVGQQGKTGDETIGVYCARLTGLPEHLVMLNNKHPLVPESTLRAGYRLVLHGLSTEMLHGLLLQLKAQQAAG